MLERKKKIIKLGYNAPVQHRLNSGFMTIEVEDKVYCASHDFWLDGDEQKELLYNAKPCFYTDGRYHEGRHNSYRRGCMLWSRRKGFTLKKAFRLLKKTRNLPLGTIVNITHNCYGTFKKSKKHYGLGYTYKVRIENKFDPQYEISDELYCDNFNTDEKARELTDLLRANGFIVSVQSRNTNFISSMIATAASYMGKSAETSDEEGEIALAYGHGIKIGYSSNNSTYQGYSSGCKDVLFDKLGEFDKWSRCRTISKEKSNEEIVKILVEVKNEVEIEIENEY